MKSSFNCIEQSNDTSNCSIVRWFDRSTALCVTLLSSTTVVVAATVVVVAVCCCPCCCHVIRLMCYHWIVAQQSTYTHQEQACQESTPGKPALDQSIGYGATIQE